MGPVEYKKVEKPAVTYTYPFQTIPVTYTAPVVKAVKPVTYTAPLTYTNTVAAPVTYTHHNMVYNNAYYPDYTDFSAQETADGKAVSGSYQVALPDGRIQYHY